LAQNKGMPPTSSVGIDPLLTIPPSIVAPCTGQQFQDHLEETECIISGDLLRAECAKDYGLLGLDFKAAPLSVRGRASLSGDKLRGLLDSLKRQGVAECAVLSTCNRTEIYYVGGNAAMIELALCEACHICMIDLRPYLRFSEGMCVACHLFRVAAGLESAVLGETEIVAQVKEAWKIAADTGTIGSRLDILLQRALEAGKRIRTETNLCRSVVSTGTLAIRVAERQHGDLKERPILIVGAGQIASRIAKELKAEGAKQVTIVNRTLAKAETVAKICRARVGSLASLEEELSRAEVVFSTVNVPEPILLANMLQKAIEHRPDARMTVVDMGVPATVESVDSGRISVVDIDELSAMGSDNERRRVDSVPQATEIVAQELVKFRSTILKRSAGSTISALIHRAELIRKQNVAWAVERQPGLDHSDLKLIEEVTKRIVKGLLEAPLEALNGELAHESQRKVIAKLFHLDEDGARHR
jgi:glutamyl-tRNA reductase